MTRTSPEAKRKAAELLMAPDRPIRNIAHLRRENSAPDYDIEAVKKVSKETGGKRAQRFVRVLKALSSSGE
ncbi:hypothetical protein [Mesorhizobium sp. WSM3864]|uniref:hypothetical protein n=1 Tax=Mesorhizobium sp. WSM3864 TaxID=2029404 RepID=UPI000BB03949|nr:hypothetical protein [Mesorhizobium sp. WSM3864]